MEKVAISLRHRLSYRSIILLVAVYLLIVMVVLYAFNEQYNSAVKNNLILKHKAVEQAFNAYLTRSEYEMSFIGQELAANGNQSGRELESLFRHHDVLFFGGLDFFYIAWSSGVRSVDPRARLFTQVDLASLLPNSLINKWVKIVTKDGSNLLMYKKKVLFKEESVGYLYGFISLNDNLTLANEMLEGADTNLIRIYDDSNNMILLEEQKADFDTSRVLFSERRPFNTPVNADLQLELVQEAPSSFTIVKESFLPLTFIALVLLALYFALLHIFNRFIFMPLESIEYHDDSNSMPFLELQPVQARNRQNQMFVEAKERRFKLLAESTGCAIVFCNEVAAIELMNAEAKQIFLGHENARTIFDFMPISCHQAIQNALKGGVGISFDTTVKSVGRLYQWQAYSFKNENSFRSVLFVGRDTTQESSLMWQLDQLNPTLLDSQQKVNVDALLSEFEYLSAKPDYFSQHQLQGWLSILVSVLDCLRFPTKEELPLALGELLCQESATVIKALNIKANNLSLLDCSVDVGMMELVVDSNLRSLVRTLLVMVFASNMAEKCLSVHWDSTSLELVAMNDMSSRPLLSWIITSLLSNLGGEQTKLQNGALRLNFFVGEKNTKVESLGPNKVVALVSNDYSNAEQIVSILLRLDLSVEHYSSADSFFTQSSAVKQFDAVLIASDHGYETQADMTKVLKQQYNRNDLPIVWLNTDESAVVASDILTLTGCLFDYNLYRILVKAFELDGIVPTQLNGQGRSWVIVGGSRVSKAIWYSEFKGCGETTQWVSDLSDFNSLLSYYPNAFVVLLEEQLTDLLVTLQETFPDAQVFSVRSWKGMPDSITLFEIPLPYSGEKIRAFKEHIKKQNLIIRNNT